MTLIIIKWTLVVYFALRILYAPDNIQANIAGRKPVEARVALWAGMIGVAIAVVTILVLIKYVG